jgi:hypothetical protein
VSRLLLRSFTLASLAGLLFVATAEVAGATELDDYLAEAGEASFAGRQATWCTYADHTEFSVVSIEHAGSLVMVERAGSSQMIGGGRNAVQGESDAGVAISNWTSIALTGRYSTAAVDHEERLGRDVAVVTVDEGDSIRARIWFDEETGATLGSEVYGGDGEVFRFSWMLDFDPYPRKIYTMMGDDGSVYDMVVGADSDNLADSVAGYVRVDTYAGPDESLHAFYADGLFSFSVFVIEGQVTTSPFSGSDAMEVGDAEYRWLLTPSDMWVQWTGDGLTYVLVGDLPPDHLELVLSELPRPSRGNILSRLWRGLFG